MRSATAVGPSTASSEDNSGIFDAQTNIPDSKAVNSSPDDEFLGFANPDEVKQSGCQILDRLENNLRTVEGALIIGQDNEALAHVLLPIKRCSQGSQNSSRDQDILTSNQCLRILSNLVAAGAITSSGLLDEILQEILAYTTFIVSIKSSELNELRAKSFSIIKVVVDNVEHDIGGSYFWHWVALADIFSQVVGCSEDASGRVMLESIACITAMLTRVNECLKELFSTPALQEVSGPNEAVKQIMDHAKTSGLADQLCLCLATAGASLISGSSDMLRSAATASVNSGILLNMGSPGVKVGMEDRDMVKAIEEDLGKYIKILLEVGVPGIVLCCLEHFESKDLGRPVAFLAKMIGLRLLAVQLLGKGLSDPTNMSRLLDHSSPKEVISDLGRVDKIGNTAYHNDMLLEELFLSYKVAIQGTTIGALLYAKGIVAFSDSRLTITDSSNGARESISDSSDKFLTISTRSNLFFVQCGNRHRNELFAKYLVYVVADREQNGELVGVDMLAGIAHRYLEDYSIEKPENTFNIGGIFIGWLSDKRYQAYKVLLQETNLHDLEHLNEIKDLEALEDIKQQIVLGSGCIYAHSVLRELGAHPQITKDEAREASLVSAHYAGMCSNYTGGPTHLYYFPHEEGFNFESSHEEVGPCILHLKFPMVYSNCFLLVRITSLVAGPLTEFEQQMTSRAGVVCTSLLVSKKGYNYYRVFCVTPTYVNTIFTEMTQQLAPNIDPESKTQHPEWWFKSVQYLLGTRLIYMDVGKYSEPLMREILAA